MFALGFLLLMATSTSTILSAYAEMTVFGHKVPDTDAISAALVYVWELGSRNISAKAYRLGELNPETSYVLESLQVAVPPLLGDLNPESQVAIVDTNNPDELPINISKMKIHSIVDHHKLNGLSNAEPLELDFRPLCSVGSILYARAKALGLTPTKQIAGLMLSGILSDSLGFRSPTTTDIDKIYATELGELAELDVHDHAENMLEAKAQLDDYSVEELVMMDTKIFRLGGKMMRVSVIETTKPLDLLAKKAALVEAQSDIAKKEGLWDVLFFVVDILNEKSIFVSSSVTATQLVEASFKVQVDSEGLAVLPGVLSRKKQMIPALEVGAANFGGGLV